MYESGRVARSHCRAGDSATPITARSIITCFRTYLLGRGSHAACASPKATACSAIPSISTAKCGSCSLRCAPRVFCAACPEPISRGAAHFLAELNAIHPFREGNGRTQLSYLTLLAARAGHPLALERMKPEAMLTAMVASFKGDEEPLAALIEGLIER